MITPAYVRMMARYNHWQNQSLIDAAGTLDDVARHQDRGAFFQSIHGTFNHLLWGDMMWMHRFTCSERPAGSIADSRHLFADWDAIKQQRAALDARISHWADTVEPAWLSSEMVWISSAAKREMRSPHALLAMHFFNHQTHHRGQIHAMLTAAGAKPDDTDLMLLANAGTN